MKKIILSIMLITVIVLSLFITPKVNAAESETNEFDVLVDKVEDLIADGEMITEIPEEVEGFWWRITNWYNW